MLNKTELISAVAEATNNDDQVALARLVLDNDFSGNVVAQEIVILGFSVGIENVVANEAAAKKISGFDCAEAFGLKAALRLEALTLRLK